MTKLKSNMTNNTDDTSYGVYERTKGIKDSFLKEIGMTREEYDATMQDIMYDQMMMDILEEEQMQREAAEEEIRLAKHYAKFW